MSDPSSVPTDPPEDPGPEPIAKKPRGFAALSPERRKELSRKGGIRAHETGTAHRFARGSEEAIEAGKKGGRASQAKNAARRAAKEGQ